ncbi:hypothetical protein HBH56_141660 [Parastagonospora nodorum]|uniref:Uncharacterized protein n=1 Tax=Phaeosphaeria nodorum (strain SN15 / ATCC MYA-4574 / FGSC 10173) TaxID=321614 RepID=Q0V4E2_PHANO|nr:hypothetical protein SNOG_01122 [Parastagonospora nodorum SN15]KAH3911156.1 hypothetical protein HBH56_141660 [Parastagonospora nodorum]EAT92617.1 hypothetical protein SNOG_01122 [Parastagonospora nodorum SN15]KAH3928012.1 hypothetical protein HBH54_146800 [Parastagonospora nodorum]KAH3938462.1 hypothetical protein HBH53_257240 [Parastagonospora nodorum]KAH3956537.1 hypothetical protein HBH51_240350 [Parastagonospora nodorum]
MAPKQQPTQSYCTKRSYSEDKPHRSNEKLQGEEFGEKSFFSHGLTTAPDRETACHDELDLLDSHQAS